MLMFVLARSELGFSWKKYQVLHADSQQLQQLGQHCIAGYQHADDVLPLIRTGAIAGVYITKRNVKNRSFAEIRAEIAMFQKVREFSGLPPLFIVTDQEGGLVSHLSPPLAHLPALSTFVDKESLSTSISGILVQAYASIHAEGLKSLGVNVNLSPVVDLKISPQRHFVDRHSRIVDRAISEDPYLVAEIALLYSRRLQQTDIIPTLKHFPGLGRVTGDTHHVKAGLDVSIHELRQTDWVPFQHIAKQTQAFLMLGHVFLSELDADYPVSCSKRVIQTIIREQWQHDGVLITDDFSMRPIYRSQYGIGGAAVAALNAGVDLILISYDGEKAYEILHALLQADRGHQVDRDMLERSHQRLERIRNQIPG